MERFPEITKVFFHAAAEISPRIFRSAQLFLRRHDSHHPEPRPRIHRGSSPPLPEMFGRGLCRRRVYGDTLSRARIRSTRSFSNVLNAMPIVYFLYAAALVGGGAMGSKVSGKSSSLLGSLAFGAVAVVAAMLLKGNPRAGLILGLIDAVAVAGFFFMRYMSTQKAMPAFPAIGMSVIVLILSFVALSSVSKTSS
jgi:uncharacterized membrane protein (UPF0136 family)